MHVGLSAGVLTMIIILFIVKHLGQYKWNESSDDQNVGQYRWNESTDDQIVETFIRNYEFLTPKRYKYLEIRRITKSFKDKLGQGGHGYVYKGELPDGQLVAVKILSEAKGSGEEFINEVATISRTSHVNVVTLLGFCYEKNKRALVYEFMVNGSLDKFISFDGFLGTNSILDLKTMYHKAVGVARGLEYLHRGCSTRIVHFDIKPHNILLDKDFCAKISDFGLAKLCKREHSIISMLGTRGTAGYIAPEVFSRTFGEVSHKSDIYSYGMLVLEMAGTRQNNEVVQTSDMYFPDRIYWHLENEQDLIFHSLTAEEKETVRKMILVDRPTASRVVEMLEGSVQSLQIPPMPLLFSSARPDPIMQSPSKSLSTSTEVQVLEGNSQPLLFPPKSLPFTPAISG
ncbi:Glycerophosphodiester phosphodiesterase [Bertholletia excelsa]